VTSAEGTLGLQRAVLAKGARSVLVSLWNVPDESTLFLIQRFYHHWLHDGNAPSKSEALRLAQADVRTEASKTSAHRDWADPFYWAAFQLVGAP
jgi:CHAT domain-containing protein